MGFPRTCLALTFVISIPVNSFGDWYILIPKAPPQERPSPKKTPPLPKLTPPKETKPYTVEVKKIFAPDFSIQTANLRKLTRKKLEGKKAIFVFLNGLYTPTSESILLALEKFLKKKKNTVIVAVDINDSDFSILKKFKKSMELKKVLLTADSYVYEQFKKKIKDLKVPSLIIIDRFGFIRYFADKITYENITTLDKELEKILKTLG
ncbi:alkyl hydroperoxide reductase/ Thiol specific antioxidant/ Mal allergen [Desulfurobacterium thermolithotrophum DSM 11699]|uniref:Alkyl hydroperoxide reductase/ Thiol specific antioxidant/ Mal allergen n=1 Tax=Desulfurobacterium thermolithotrophum (strain DSM 11699 / BSA) TaxID=868864 RepID=F0S212_DESTD|nr:redoxin domain-containing protein [Desulfurobacterium thermolithotrophum]ADY74093.1 alkyl hydroperoxide reductase/ Thiol specific antioxidant/ Mal allergen [Desulfurobacterium thermolithotrophum DSM 11699]